MSRRLHKRITPMPARLLTLWCVNGIIALTTCNCVAFSKPDQSQFAQLTMITERDEPLVRIYAAPIPKLEHIAVHCWFVIKPINANACDRWELWQTAHGPYEHVRKNMMAAEAGVGAGGTFVLREFTGDSAVQLIAVIENESPHYPCRATYTAYPGPNSNTYVQWVLHRAEVDYRLPCAAVGAAYICDEP